MFLVGMMGAGKSSVGAALAQSLRRRFVDLDRVIEDEAGVTVAQLFASEGEAAFRARESRLLRAMDAAHTVIATGGGVVTRPENVEHLLSQGRVVYLRTSPETIRERLARQPGGIASRPLLQGDAHALVDLIAQRSDAYERAHHAVDTDGRTIDELVQLIEDVL